MTNRPLSFTDLDVWQQAHELRIQVLKLLLEFPDNYRFGLSSQLQRSVISIGSNIAEGFGRQNKKEKLQFYRIARGSLVEVQDQLMVVRDMDILSPEVCEQLLSQVTRVHQLIHGLMRSLANKPDLRLTNSEARSG